MFLGLGVVRKDEEISENILIAGEHIGSDVAGLLLNVVGSIMEGGFDSDIDKFKAEVLVLLAVFDKLGEVGSDFGLYVFDLEEFG